MASLATDLQIPKVPMVIDQKRSDRHAQLRDIAKESWLARTDIGYSVLTYDSVMGILRDKRWHSATGMVAQLQGITDEAFLGRRQVSILSAEGEVHVRLRRLVAPAFSPRSADRLRPFMRETVNSLLDPFMASGKAEVVSDICEPYPIPIICELLGAPKEDWKLFSRLASEILLIFSENLAENMPVFLAAQQELEKYTEGLIEKRRSVPEDTFDITREPVGQPHLSLGAGIHYCLGASLARAELQEAFTVLSQRMTNLELDGPVVYKPSGIGIFGPASLPVKFSPNN